MQPAMRNIIATCSNFFFLPSWWNRASRRIAPFIRATPRKRKKKKIWEMCLHASSQPPRHFGWINSDFADWTLNGRTKKRIGIKRRTRTTSAAVICSSTSHDSSDDETTNEKCCCCCFCFISPSSRTSVPLCFAERQRAQMGQLTTISFQLAALVSRQHLPRLRRQLDRGQRVPPPPPPSLLLTQFHTISFLYFFLCRHFPTDRRAYCY